MRIPHTPQSQEDGKLLVSRSQTLSAKARESLVNCPYKNIVARNVNMACLCLSFSSFVTAAADIASSSSIFSVMPAALDAIILLAPLKTESHWSNGTSSDLTPRGMIYRI